MQNDITPGAWVQPANPDHRVDADVRPGRVVDHTSITDTPPVGEVLVTWTRTMLRWEDPATLVRVASPDEPGPCFRCGDPLSGRVTLIDYGGHRLQVHTPGCTPAALPV